VEYLGIADHSKSSVQAKGLTEERLMKQVEEIAALNASGRFKTRVFAGTECDILPDGRLDFEAEVLAKLDYVVVSVHSTFTQDEATMTARIIRAIEHPCRRCSGISRGGCCCGARATGGCGQRDRRGDREPGEHRAERQSVADGDGLAMVRGRRRSADCGRRSSDAHETGDLGYVRAGVSAARKAG